MHIIFIFLLIILSTCDIFRLAFEIARMGFECQGNEFSLFMLFTSNFVLNKCKSPNVFKVASNPSIILACGKAVAISLVAKAIAVGFKSVGNFLKRL